MIHFKTYFSKITVLESKTSFTKNKNISEERCDWIEPQFTCPGPGVGFDAPNKVCFPKRLGADPAAVGGARPMSGIGGIPKRPES